MSVKKIELGEVSGGIVYGITISNGVINVNLMNYGATITAIFLPDKNGKLINVVARLDSLSEYFNTFGYFGATVGRMSGRIVNGKFKIGEKEFKTTVNQNGHTLHGGAQGFDKKVWRIDESASSENKVVFTYVSSDGEEGFPSKLFVKTIYTVTEENALRIEYEAETDGETIVGLLNHSYFNLNGDDRGNV